MTETDYHSTVGDALAILVDGLSPFVERVFAEVLPVGATWPELLRRKDMAAGRRVGTYGNRDLSLMLRALTERLGELGFPFDRYLPRSAQNYASELRDVRNRWAHNETFTADQARRAIETAELLLREIGASEHADRIVGLKPAVAPGRHAKPEPEAEEPLAAAPEAETTPRIAIQAVTDLSYPMAHCRIPVIDHIAIDNTGAELHGAVLELDVTSAAGSHGGPKQIHLDLAARAPTILRDVDLLLDPASMLTVDEPRPGTVRAVLRDANGAIQAQADKDVTILAGNQWKASPPQLALEMLAAHVQPNATAIAALMPAVSDGLAAWTRDSAIDAYQSGDPDRVDAIARAVFDAMQARGIRHAWAPANWRLDSQKVRTPAQVLNGRLGTSLDATLTMAAALEHAGINSTIWVLNDHAFLGYWRINSALDSVSTTNVGGVVSQIHLGNIRVIETDILTRPGQGLTFLGAADFAKRRHILCDLSEILGITDVRQARRAGICPLPSRSRGAKGNIEVVHYQPVAELEAGAAMPTVPAIAADSTAEHASPVERNSTDAIPDQQYRITAAVPVACPRPQDFNTVGEQVPMAIADQEEKDMWVRRATNLFTFLGRAQELKAKPVRTVDKFQNAIWFSDLPEHPAVRSAHRIASLEPDAPILQVDRVPKLDPPAVPDQLNSWIVGAVDDPREEPSIREAIYERTPLPDGGGPGGSTDSDRTHRRADLTDVPEMAAAFEDWLSDWKLWAERERRDAVVRDIYKELFAVHLKSVDHGEEFELVLGVGCLSWRPQGHEHVLRHVTTAPIAVRFDEKSGTLTVIQVTAPQALSIELDMLDPALIPSPAKIDEIRQRAANYEGHVLDQPAISAICRPLILRLDADAEYEDEAVSAPNGSSPRGAFAPAIILRRRSKHGLVQLYQQIVAQIQASGEVPQGILPFIDPDRQPAPKPNTTPGAMVTIGDEIFLPLPMNDTQRKIIERVDRTAQTVVQGPPGTGKTHTAAALVSHLLAQGMRVLITAQTDRALQEVRAKLPREIQSLAVSVIGQSRSDMADLRTAVDNISRRADDFDVNESRKTIDGHLAKLDDLRRQRAETYQRLIAVRRQETEMRTDGPASGTLAAIAYRHLQQQSQFEWIREFEVDAERTGQTVGSDEILRWRDTLLDRDLIDSEAEARRHLPDLAALADPRKFADLVVTEQRAITIRDRYAELMIDTSFEFVRLLAPQAREELRVRVSGLADRAAALERRDEAWMNEALHDVRSGRQQTWVARAVEISSLAHKASTHINNIGPTTSVVVTDGDINVHQQLAKSLLSHIESGNQIKALADGRPKLNAFSPKNLKLAAPFFDGVKVNGLPAVTRGQLVVFLHWVEASRALTAMDHVWPASVHIPEEDTLSERLHWHHAEVAQLNNVLALGKQLEDERRWFRQNDVPVPDWNDLKDIRRYATLVEAAAAVDDLADATAPIEELVDYLQVQVRSSKAATVVGELLEAVQRRDAAAYMSVHGRTTHLHRVAQTIAGRDRIRVELDRSAPRLARAISDNPSAPEWDGRLSSYAEAWSWEMTGRWILAQESEDSNALRVRLNMIERQIRNEIECLAAERAWGHVVAPGRLTGVARANLIQYAGLVSSLGKGMGKYAAKKRAEITEAMGRCRPSVPVWILPIYRIAEQMRIQANLFDVVIIDEASQAGLEASFLQFLAPKVVVIGDDKQVSPSAVGVDQQQLRDLANMYLADDTYRASWLDPTRSYFDEANMRFGGRITLTEHRRCAPEIIGFSNRIAYEPEGIRLVPVRQFGAERLDPIKVTYLADGFEAENKTNPVEAGAIVSQIQKCLTEPQYDGLTFGVISLLGKEQAKLIEHKLLDTIAPEEWAARELRCGDASDFQGSERDVMFLSMVKTAEPDKRLSALTATKYVQRFNVAGSRAKDQMWVYHSMPRDALTNKEDMRFALLDYCYGIVNRLHSAADQAALDPVSEDLLVPPFQSLFEQRVFNRIVDRGYTVVPQFPALGYSIDLVVRGAEARLAIECDGDFWHGAAQYEHDLARQRELERCGWEFFRIRESLFYADMPGMLEKLWDRLDELGIRTADWVDPNSIDEVAGGTATDVDTTPSYELPSDADENETLAGPLKTSVEGLTCDPEASESTATTATSRYCDDEIDRTNEQRVASTNVTAAAREVRRPARNAYEHEHDEPVDDFHPVVSHALPLLAPYVAFSEALLPAHETPLNTVVANMVRIVAVEGPVLGHRLHQAYRDAYGGSRVGKEIARLLNRAVMLAERRGQIVSNNPLKEPGVKPRTFRLPNQPLVLPRELGPRTLDLVPPEELAHHLADLSAGVDVQSEEEMFRAVLELLGLKRLTDNVKSVLGSALQLVHTR